MPKLIRLYIVNVAVGFVLAIVFTGLLVAFDIAHLRHLVLADAMGWVAVVMLVTFHTVLFAGVQFAIAVMSLAERDDDTGKGRRAPASNGRALASVPAKSPNRTR